MTSEMDLFSKHTKLEVISILDKNGQSKCNLKSLPSVGGKGSAVA